MQNGTAICDLNTTTGLKDRGETFAVNTDHIRKAHQDEQFSRAISRYLKEGNRYAHLACTGAGAGLQELLWSIPGASQMLAGAVFPYAVGSPERFVQRPVEKSVSATAALQLASASFIEAQKAQAEHDIGKNSRHCVGLGVTAAVVTERERRGEDQVFIAAQTFRGSYIVHVSFEKSRFDRRESDKIVSQLALNMLFFEAGLPQLPIGKGTPIHSEQLQHAEGGMILNPRKISLSHLAKSWNGHEMLISPEGALGDTQSFVKNAHTLLPASINPFHWGHDAVAMAVTSRTGLPFAFELSLDNIDKAEIPIEEALRRAEGLLGRWPVLITKGCPLFIDKSRRYNSSFAMGMDTAERLVSAEPRYTRGLPPATALQEMASRGTQLFVATRPWRDSSGAISRRSLREVLPERTSANFTEIGLNCFVSSGRYRDPIKKAA